MAKSTVIDPAVLQAAVAAYLASNPQAAAKSAKATVTLTPVEDTFKTKPVLRFRAVGSATPDAPWVGAFTLGPSKIRTILANLKALESFAAKHK